MNLTYMDQMIADGQNETISLKNLYDTALISSKEGHIFRVPINDFFLQHRAELDSCIELYSLNQEMFYKPKALSLQLYGTTELWVSLLRVNEMRNITEFHQPYIKVYNPNKVKELIKIFFKREGKV